MIVRLLLRQNAVAAIPFSVFLEKSTVPVGTSRKIEEPLKTLRPDADFGVCSNPSFCAKACATPLT